MLTRSNVQIRPLFLLLVFLVTLFSQWTMASAINIGGFFSTGVTDSRTDNPLLRSYGIEDKTNYLADTVFGLQFDSALREDTWFAAQLVARDKNNSFDLEAEWLFVSHQLSNSVVLRAGRMRLPFYLLSESRYVGQSYDWVHLPFEIYNLTAGLNRYNGISAVYRQEFVHSTMEVEFLFGQAKDNLTVFGSPATFNTDSLYGGQINFISDQFSARAAIVDLKTVFSFPARVISANTGGVLKIVGFDITRDNWELMWEYGSVESDREGDTNALYLSLHYFIGQWAPLITFGASNTHSPIVGNSVKGESLAIGCRYDFNESTSFKADVLYGELFEGITLLSVPAAFGFTDKVTVFSISLNITF